MKKRKQKKPEYTPNPGSDEAAAVGCLCPRLDNNYGAGVSPGLFVMSEDCPLHGAKSKRPASQISPRSAISMKLDSLGFYDGDGVTASQILAALECAARRAYPDVKHVALASFGKLGWRFVEAVRLPAKEEA